MCYVPAVRPNTALLTCGSVCTHHHVEHARQQLVSYAFWTPNDTLTRRGARVSATRANRRSLRRRRKEHFIPIRVQYLDDGHTPPGIFCLDVPLVDLASKAVFLALI